MMRDNKNQRAGSLSMHATLKNILCIDDEQDILDIAKFALENLGHFKLQTICGGKEALARAPLLRPDLVLIDVMMPGMDGIQVYATLRKIPAFATMPFAFMTAKVQPSEVLRYLEMGIEGIIPKPFDPMTLSGAVLSLWESRRKKESAPAQPPLLPSETLL